MTKPSRWSARVRAAERSGDFIFAYDLAARGLAEHPDNINLKYLATRVLARTGATEQAAALYKKYQLGRDRRLDFAMLGARIDKDRALNAFKCRGPALRSAAAVYGRIYRRTRDAYPAVNAATLYLLAGDHKRAEEYARRVLEKSTHVPSRSALDRYYQLATQAEAALIRRQIETAQETLHEAACHLGGDFDAAATTRKQLRLVCRSRRINAAVLDIIRPPAVLHYFGSAILKHHATLNRRRQREFVDRILESLTHHSIGYAYGSLAAGCDILCAEACLQAKVELHVILPFNQREFVEKAVRLAGLDWLNRFKKCLARAKSVTFATTDSYQNDEALFTYGCRLAMGMAILRSRHLDTALLHLRLQIDGWDPDPPGYAANLRLWQKQGHPSQSLRFERRSLATSRLRKPSGHKNLPARSARALVFGDVAGFSRTPDYLIPAFQNLFMGTIAGVLRKYGRHVIYRNSWGDAIYLVMDEPTSAVRCCLAIQRAIADIRPSGLSPDLGLRLAAHFGPVYDGYDAIRDERTFFGAHTTFAARMEPVTPPGHVYVTEAMAAAIAMENPPRLRVEYVGTVPLAKNFGSARLYSLFCSE